MLYFNTVSLRILRLLVTGDGYRLSSILNHTKNSYIQHIGLNTAELKSRLTTSATLLFQPEIR